MWGSASVQRSLLRGPRWCLLASRDVRTAAAATASSSSPAASISVHKGFKLQAALCVERPPTRVLEPDYKLRWKAFREAWEKRTDNNLSVEDEIVFMRFHFHFLEADGTAQRAGLAGSPLRLGGRQGGGGKEKDTATGDVLAATRSQVASGVDALLSEEGLGNLVFPERGKRATRRRRVQRQVVKQVDDSDVRSVERLASSSLYLLVRYPGATHWTFPKADRAHGEPMRETLLKLCGRQLGATFEPYIVGSCPFSYRKKKSERHPGIDGRKIFYYRARLVPGMTTLDIPSSSPVTDFAWYCREELAKHLGEKEWHAVRDSLPLDSL